MTTLAVLFQTQQKEDTSSFLPDNCLNKNFVNIGGTLVQGLGSAGGFPFSSAVHFCCKSHLEEAGVNRAAYVITAGQNINTSRWRRMRATHNRLVSLNSASQRVRQLKQQSNILICNSLVAIVPAYGRDTNTHHQALLLRQRLVLR